MFLLLRVGLVIAVIFYCSPVRKQDAGHGRVAGTGSSTPRQPSPAPAPERRASPSGAPEASAQRLLSQAEQLWSSLPEDAQRAVLDRLRDEVAAALGNGLETHGAARSAADAPRPGDRHADRRLEEPPRRP